MTVFSKIETVVVDKFSATLSDYQTDLHQNWHSHDEFVLVMLLRGNVREQVKCRDTLIEAFDVGIKSPDVKHTDHFCPKGVRVIRLSIAPEFVAELKSKSLINEGWYWVKGSKAVSPFLRIGQSLVQSKPAIEDDIYEVFAALLPEKRTTLEVPKWLKQARQFIDETFADGVRLNRIANYADVHPVYFARKFRQFFGCSVGTYIRRLQFKQVHNLLVSGKFNLAQIAAEAGFSDQAHLTRTLSAEYGITPAKLRKILK